MVSKAGTGSAGAPSTGGAGSVSRHILPSAHHQDRSIGGKPGKRPAALSVSPDLSHMSQNRKKNKLASFVAAAASASTSSPAKMGATHAPLPYSRGMFLAFVDNALQERRKGRSGSYNELVSQFRAVSPTSMLDNAASSRPSGSASTSTASAPSSATLKAYLEALTHYVAQLDRSTSSLVEAITSLPWTAMDDLFVNAYVRFVQALLSARSEFVGSALDKIIRGFRFQSHTAYSSEGSSQQLTDAVTRRQTYERLHRLLSSLIYLIPTLPSTLWPVLNRHFPHKRENRNSQVVYISNALRIIEYCPSLGENVLGAVILRALDIDTEIQVDVEELEDEDGQLDQEVFGYTVENAFDRVVGDEDDSDSESDNEGQDLDAISSGSDHEGDMDNDNGGEDVAAGSTEKKLTPKAIKRLKEMAAKLDAIMKVIFDFLQRLSSSSHSNTRTPTAIERAFSFLPTSPSDPSLAPNAETPTLDAVDAVPTTMTTATVAILRRTIFDILLTIFDEKVLHTFKTRHVQFIFFWYASLSAEFADHFTGSLISRALDDRDTPIVTRAAAAGYVASFVARAQSIDRIATQRVMGLLCTYLEDEMEELRHALMAVQTSAPSSFHTASAADKIAKSSVIFYAVVQAACYIFCFRWRDLLEENEHEIEDLEGVPSSRRWVAELDILKQAITSGFNPLLMCSSIVTTQFARMAHKTDFMYCHSIVDANNRQSRSRRNTVIAASPTSDNYSSDDLGARPPHPSLPRSTSQPSTVDSVSVKQTLKEAQIDSHFPFDPYKLPLSATFITDIYRAWDSGFVEDDEDDDADTEAEDSSAVSTSVSDSAGDDYMATSMNAAPYRPSFDVASVPMHDLIDPALLGHNQTSLNHGFSASFEAMSVSPRR